MVSNTDDVIDSREVIERISEIEIETQSRYADEHPEGVSWGEMAGVAEHVAAYLDDEDVAEYTALKALADEAGETPDWEYGEILIRDSYFEDYAREMATKIGAIPSDSQWPLYCIDWERAARELQMDYFSVDFDGVTYWVRA